MGGGGGSTRRRLGRRVFGGSGPFLWSAQDGDGHEGDRDCGDEHHLDDLKGVFGAGACEGRGDGVHVMHPPVISVSGVSIGWSMVFQRMPIMSAEVSFVSVVFQEAKFTSRRSLVELEF